MDYTNKDHKPVSHDSRVLRRQSPTFDRLAEETLRNDHQVAFQKEVAIDCGWGRLLLGHTFEDPLKLARILCSEKKGERDIAIYVDEPHLALSHAPQALFLDPSDTYRLWLSQYRQSDEPNTSVRVRRATTTEDLDLINTIYLKRDMLPIQKEVFLQKRLSSYLYYLIAESAQSNQALGAVMGVNHIKAYNDPTHGASLWCLAVMPNSTVPGVGEALVRYLCEHFQTRGCEYIDLSVMCSNRAAKQLYEKIGFRKIKSFTLKTKNAFNEKLFTAADNYKSFNPYAQILVDEALRRGIDVQIESTIDNRFTLCFGGRKVRCYESLSDLTTAYSMILCQNKFRTYQALEPHGIATPNYERYTDLDQANIFLETHKAIVVKPSDCEQGQGVSLNINSPEALAQAIELAKQYSQQILLESYHTGQDLRVVVIGHEVVAAAIRQPAEVVGNGRDTIEILIKKQSRRRQQATGGESKIPLDAQTERCIKEQNYHYASILPKGEKLSVRKTANLHTGGTLIDVTCKLSQSIEQNCVHISKILQIPVVGLDFMVTKPESQTCVFIEANERPGLANHEPQPTAQKFMDLLFPLSH